MCENFLCRNNSPRGTKSIHSNKTQKTETIKTYFFRSFCCVLYFFSMDATRNLGCILIIFWILLGWVVWRISTSRLHVLGLCEPHQSKIIYMRAGPKLGPSKIWPRHVVQHIPQVIQAQMHWTCSFKTCVCFGTFIIYELGFGMVKCPQLIDLCQKSVSGKSLLENSNFYQLYHLWNS